MPELSTIEKQLNSLKLKSDDYQKNLRFYEEANTALNKYIENQQSPLVNKGKTIPECKSRKQSTKKISILKERVNKALWFAKSFGVDLQELKVDDSAGSTHDLLKNTKPAGRYDQMPETEQDKVKSLLYVLDKFGVSDDAYHELAVYNNGLPRSYLIKQCRQDINDICTITQTPDKSPSAQLTLKETLDRLLTRHDIEVEIPVIQIKFAADGAKMSRMSNFLVLSLAVLNRGEEVMSVSGQHTLAIVDGKEDFISIQESLSDIFKDINSLLAKRNEIGYIPYQSSSGQKYLLELFLGGDMKFLLISLGLNAANANFACLYCKIEKKNRYDMSKTFTGTTISKNQLKK
ncbi:unnamed protein product [Mytilus coruscus]|uniref:Uncharacterized protein n=1 Tax=Mytilus coruscus TaxID=42192 RepID=A0A6J8BD13_MYTCO|nr:unnamed protein product [Mytilus coruscus]